ncbi:MAG: SRPBCC domain-containing protein [Bacteroidetes bacterium]|nr:SRPBCC domain-containing protein [Bacteroidota bacterium]
MTPQKLEIKTALQIGKTPQDVFEAIVDPAKMTNYFISTSTGRMEEGKNLVWRFPEFDEDVSIRVGKMEQDKYISFFWEINGKELLVEITLILQKNNSTLLRISEKSMDNDEAGIKWLMENTAGWANFLDCLKAYLEFGINLRKGGYDYYKKS